MLNLAIKYVHDKNSSSNFYKFKVNRLLSSDKNNKNVKNQFFDTRSTFSYGRVKLTTPINGS